jgi:hypothetical protein
MVERAWVRHLDDECGRAANGTQRKRITTSFHTSLLKRIIWATEHQSSSVEELKASAFPSIIGFRHLGPYLWRMIYVGMTPQVQMIACAAKDQV